MEVSCQREASVSSPCGTASFPLRPPEDQTCHELLGPGLEGGGSGRALTASAWVLSVGPQARGQLWPAPQARSSGSHGDVQGPTLPLDVLGCGAGIFPGRIYGG